MIKDLSEKGMPREYFIYFHLQYSLCVMFYLTPKLLENISSLLCNDPEVRAEMEL